MRRKIKTHRREWIEQCKVVKDEINQAKEQKWREVVEEAIGSEDDRKIWSFIKSLDGTTGTTPTGEVMIHGKARLISNKAKANIFSSHYASVSRLKFNKNERTTNCEAKQMLRSKGVDDESTQEISMPELEKAIQRMRAKGAPGPDDIPPTFIKALGPTDVQPSSNCSMQVLTVQVSHKSGEAPQLSPFSKKASPHLHWPRTDQ